MTDTISPTEARQGQAARFAAELGLDAEALYAGAMAAWSNLNPQSVAFELALSAAAAVLLAATRQAASRHAADTALLVTALATSDRELITAVLTETAGARDREARGHRWVGERFAAVRAGLRAEARRMRDLAGRLAVTR
jgi:hypothetical protein